MRRSLTIPHPLEATRKLLGYCRMNDWAGHDPYDALNSELLAAFPRLDSRIPRLLLTQSLKRSPVDLRCLLRVPKTQNPKALGLFLASVLKLRRLGLVHDPELPEDIVARLGQLRSGGRDHWCWGYSFPWQTRTGIVPRWAPNLVCTTFVSTALLDAYEEFQEPRYLEMALSAAEYLLRDLYWTEGEQVAGFCYPLPSFRPQIHNANLLAAALFCRISRMTGEKKFLEPALRAARFSARKQRQDGSWPYGELPHQNWIDNFHTGYNLCALRSLGQFGGTSEFESHIRRGFEFYRDHFFRKDGAPRYFHDRTYPIDAHCVAQSIITLIAFRDFDRDNVKLAYYVLSWAVSHMWDRRGYFYYRVLPFCTIRISYIRWSQAWMLLALSTLLEGERPPVVNPELSSPLRLQMKTLTTISVNGADSSNAGYTYVLITAARNEAAFIEETIKSVVGQTVRPLKWVIVSDGSTDGTDDIIKRYAAEHPWIELVRMPERRERHFAGKVSAFNAGHAKICEFEYDVIGNLDADLSFDPDYFAFLLGKFAEDPDLGVAGTPYREGGKMYDYRFSSIEHVSGACQMFRRQCFEAVGGYLPIASGGVDLIAVLSARARGWKTRTYMDKSCEHHRKMGAAQCTGFQERIHRGRMDYLLGSHPVWEIFRSVYQIRNRPYVLGGILILFGYVWAMLRGCKRTIPKELMKLRRNDQMRQLKRIIEQTLVSRH